MIYVSNALKNQQWDTKVVESESHTSQFKSERKQKEIEITSLEI